MNDTKAKQVITALAANVIPSTPSPAVVSFDYISTHKNTLNWSDSPGFVVLQEQYAFGGQNMQRHKRKAMRIWALRSLSKQSDDTIIDAAYSQCEAALDGLLDQMWLAYQDDSATYHADLQWARLGEVSAVKIGPIFNLMYGYEMTVPYLEMYRLPN